MAAITSSGTGGGVWSAGASWTGGVAPVEGDTVQIRSGDTITLDASVTVGADSATPAIDVLSGGTLNWDNLGSDTLTLKGDFYVRTGGTVTFSGTSNLANVLTINLNYSASLAANKYKWFVEAGGTVTVSGFDKTRPYDTIASDCALGQKVVVTANDNSAVWAANDSVLVTHTASAGTSNQIEAKTIASFAGASVTVNTNFTYAHKATYGYVLNLSRNIVVQPYNVTYSTGIQVTGTATLAFSWMTFLNFGSSGMNGIFNLTAGASAIDFNYCVMNGGPYYSLAYSSSLRFAAGRSWSYNIIYNNLGLLAVLPSSCEFHDNFIAALTGTLSCHGNGSRVYNNVLNRAGYYNYIGTVHSVSFYGNKFISSATGLALGTVGNLINWDVHDNAYYACTTAIEVAFTLGCTLTDEIVGDATLPCTTAVKVSAGGYINDTVITNLTGSWTTGYTVAAGLTAGTEVRFADFNGANVDFTVKEYGYLYRVGSGLTDTTVRTSAANKFAIRFESISSVNALTWQFPVPTGDITGRTMTIAVWCKIANAAYYGGTHANPTLDVNYDNGTHASCVAVDGTDWQLLAVNFTPTTTYGQITVTLSTLTDQTGANAYVYFDDFAVLYPAGYKLDLGGMDLWANALPITPPIATVLSANDVWTAQTSTLTGTGTVGKLVTKLLTVSKFLGLK